MEVLIDVLEKESQEYENLLALSMKKTPVIVSEDLEQLAKITDEEQIIVSRINHLDHQRNEAVNDIANVLNKDVEKLKIVDLIKMLAARPEEQEKLAIVFDKLQDNVRSVKRINEQNRELIQEALELVQFNMNVLQAMNKAPETANYNKGAYNTGDMIGSSYKAFDAKQ
ncbi:MAG: flagellar protein FlgN [Lachnospiraceae bacterium]|nr:flagellar protein FlgN [Lachnospiraceae bacterium]MBD5484961.1 flagellar protein FlgN [Lachnospiraceae bacterium]MBD5489935.1 flagellar protein FlgN [Lachnospiraceae bacterium]MBD5502430.1 flagellar protein FlgN [Lachnospiraceae bacterium]MBD5513706.1 flagellar protein FlgN [Lachnospiraceae bacterium]